MRPQDRDYTYRIAALRAGDRQAIAQFLQEIAPAVWAACSLLTASEADAREAFLEVVAKLRADNFALVAEYSGRGTLESFVTLTVRDLLAHRVLQLLPSDRQKGWRAFEALFQSDLKRLIRRRLPGADQEEARREAYQTICMALVDRDFHRLTSYAGSGSFAGFVLRTADRLLIDFMRATQSRRRLPNAVARMNALDRDVFKLVYWRGLPERPDALAPHLNKRLEAPPSSAEIAAALLRVKVHAREPQDGARATLADMDLQQLADEPESSPEAQLVQAEESERLTAALAVLSRAIETLPEAERLYLKLVLALPQIPPSREVARLMRRPVEDIYKLKQRVLKRLHDLIVEESAVKNWRASV